MKSWFGTGKVVESGLEDIVVDSVEVSVGEVEIIHEGVLAEDLGAENAIASRLESGVVIDNVALAEKRKDNKKRERREGEVRSAYKPL